MRLGRIFFISGLGADQRTFDFLNLDYSELITYINWIPPQPNEKLATYCSRLIEKYQIDQNSIVIGLSFGGVVAVEITKQVRLLKTIIISSVRNRQDFSLAFKISGKLHLYKLIPKNKMRKRNLFMEKGFGASTYDEKKLLANVINNMDVDVAKWAIGEMTNWKETGKNENVVRIHGSNDKIIPLKNQADYIIKNGGHMMIAQRADEISTILNSEIK